MLVSLPQYGGQSYEPQEYDGNDCVAMDPLDGYYFHNENCASNYTVLCKADIIDNSEYRNGKHQTALKIV